MELEIKNTPLDGLCVIKRTRKSDERGYFERLYCGRELAAVGFDIVQINHSFSKSAGTLRGMHFQFPPYGEDKIVTCLSGEILDVAVDIRKGSPTFLAWHGEILSSANNKSLMIPKGFAHGFQTLSDDCELLYLHSASYTPSAEGRINPFDNAVGIDWPLEAETISQPDATAAMLTNEFVGI